MVRHQIDYDYEWKTINAHKRWAIDEKQRTITRMRPVSGRLLIRGIRYHARRHLAAENTFDQFLNVVNSQKHVNGKFQRRTINEALKGNQCPAISWWHQILPWRHLATKTALGQF